MRLSEAQARSRLAGARVARLGTVGDGGQPHLVPVTFALDGTRVYIAVDHKPKTTTDLKRLRNIRRNPQVALLADHYEDDWSALWWARADGEAAILTGPAALRHPLDLLAAKYPQYAALRPEGPVIAIAVTRWAGWTSSPPTRFCSLFIRNGPAVPLATPPLPARPAARKAADS